MAHPDMKVSLKVIKNKYYKILPVVKMANGMHRPVEKMGVNDKLMGIYPTYAKSGTRVWPENSGIIYLHQMSEEAKEYVVNELSDKKHLKVFAGLGD